MTAGTLTDPLAPAELDRLAALEGTVDAGLRTFAKVGQALLEIRDHRLYRGEHETFESYCQARFSFSRQRAHQLIGAAEVSTAVDVATERHARELVPLKDDEAELVEAWREAQEEAERHGHRLTAATVRNAVQRRVRRIQREADAEDARSAEATCDRCDTTGPLSAVAHIVTFSQGKQRTLCQGCAELERQEHQQRQEAEWQALSEDERERRTRAAADAETVRKLEGALRAFDPSGECSVAGFIRAETESLRELDAGRYPEHARRLAAVARDCEDAAREMREWAEGAA